MEQAAQAAQATQLSLGTCSDLRQNLVFDKGWAMNAETVKINALRGLAALAVLFAHADANYLVYHPAISAQKEILGTFGVELFFILSGALIWRSAKPLLSEGRIGTYVLHRATRVLPLYWIVIATCVFAVPLIGTAYVMDTSLDAIWRHLTFTQNFEPNVSRAFNPVLWTLAYEAAFYAAIPLVLRWAHPSVWLACAAAAIYLLGPQLHWQYLSLFAVGMAYEELRAGGRTWLRWGGITAGLLALATVWYLSGRWTIPLAAGACAMVYLVTLPRWTVWPLAPVAAVGVISYSLYAWHYVLLELIGFRNGQWSAMFGDLWANGLIRALIVLAAIMIISTLSWLLIERPFMGPVRRWLSLQGANNSTPLVAKPA